MFLLRIIINFIVLCIFAVIALIIFIFMFFSELSKCWIWDRKPSGKKIQVPGENILNIFKR